MIGEYEVVIDGKGRFLFPSALKKQIDPSNNDTFIVNRGFEKCLNIFPQIFWNKLVQYLNANLNLFNSEHRRFYRALVNGAKMVTLDTQGRMLIPATLLQHAEIKKEAILLCYADRIEMWAPENYRQEISKISSEEFARMGEEILGKITNIIGK